MAELRASGQYEIGPVRRGGCRAPSRAPFPSRALLLVAATSLLAGCDTTRQSSHQLERVAKDWCLAIRASQIIPVYPLTEDVQPGDVFLVQVPYETQIKVYKDKGFLPLENMVHRMYPVGYFDFYKGRYGISGPDAFPPKMWQFPDGGTVDYSGAPRAAFPTYGFSVSRSEGLSAAAPVQGIPVGLNLLNTASASGQVSIKKVFTYGMGVADMQRQANAWAASNQDFLQQFADEPTSTAAATATSKPARRGDDAKGRERVRKNQFLLRVVNRVYLTNEVAISLFANQAFAGSGDAGVKRPVELLDISGKNATEAFAKVNEIINKPEADKAAAAAAATKADKKPATGAGNGAAGGGGAAGGAAASGPPATRPATRPADDQAPDKPLVGASVKVTMASDRSVSLTETFDRPLVIGYLAFDLPILPGGELGPPVSTQAQLERRKPVKGRKDVTVQFDERDPNMMRIVAWLNQDPPIQNGPNAGSPDPNGPNRTKYNQFVSSRMADYFPGVAAYDPMTHGPQVLFGTQFRKARAEMVEALLIP